MDSGFTPPTHVSRGAKLLDENVLDNNIGTKAKSLTNIYVRT